MRLTELQRATRRGEHFDYLFFWGHRPRPDGKPSAACFSQWFPACFVVDGQAYATAEHYMMAEKARIFGDSESWRRIIASDSPHDAKKLGRAVRGYDDKTWLANREEAVYRGNLAKFSQHAGFQAFLAGTGDKILVEASPVDRIWGIGLAGDDTRAANPATWNGLNLLGFVLMDVRAALVAAG